MKFLILISCVALSQALSFGKTNFLVKKDVEAEPITPYAFSYTADATDGSSARQETADANGKPSSDLDFTHSYLRGVVRGSYSMVTADGIKRIVTYIADENGFRAKVDTNEPGTESKSAADTIVQSSQLPAEEIALKYGPRPDEKPELAIKALGVKSLPKNILLSRPLLTEFPIQKRLELTLPEVIPRVETPIRLLSKISPKVSYQPIAFGVQQKEELIPQSFESF